jgi:hypothetical protein
MTTKERIQKKISENKNLQKFLAREKYATAEGLAQDCLRYASACRDGRLLCNIESVSSSGMSRVMAFYEIAKLDQPLNDGRKFCLLNFNQLFRALGYTRSGDGFRVSGCGMDMVFATNYEIVHSLAALGAVSAAEVKKLAQITPPYL